jgi:hypothetical protein
MPLMGIGVTRLRLTSYRVATFIATGLDSRLAISVRPSRPSMETAARNSIADFLSQLQMGGLNSFPQS